MRALLFAALAGCVVYVPPSHFSSGSRWTFPLVDPLRDDKLLVVIQVDGRGPFLVTLDPEAKQTTIDREVVSDNWSEKVKPEVELANVVIGDLTIDALTATVSDRDAKLDDGGRRIYGVIGRDVLNGALVFGFDRDRGIAWLAQPTDTDLAGATPLGYHDVADHSLLAATVAGQPAALAVELGEVANQLRRTSWAGAKLEVHPGPVAVVDRMGVHRTLSELGTAHALHVGTLQPDSVDFVAYDSGSAGGSGGSGSGSSSASPGLVDGTLGLDFFRSFVVNDSRPTHTLYVTPRRYARSDATVRLARWGRQMLDACKAAGCVELAVVAHPRDDGSERVQHGERGTVRGWLADLTDGPSVLYTFDAVRDPTAAGADVQVVFAATAKDGAALPWIEVDLGAGSDSVVASGDARYAGAALEVVDISPFPRLCGRGVTGCISLVPNTTPNPTEPRSEPTTAP